MLAVYYQGQHMTNVTNENEGCLRLLAHNELIMCRDQHGQQDAV